jgi:hypothetical protein
MMVEPRARVIRGVLPYHSVAVVFFQTLARASLVGVQMKYLAAMVILLVPWRCAPRSKRSRSRRRKWSDPSCSRIAAG